MDGTRLHFLSEKSLDIIPSYAMKDKCEVEHGGTVWIQLQEDPDTGMLVWTKPEEEWEEI